MQACSVAVNLLGKLGQKCCVSDSVTEINLQYLTQFRVANLRNSCNCILFRTQLKLKAVRINKLVAIGPKNAVWLATNKANGGKTILHVAKNKEIFTRPLFLSPFFIFLCLTLLNSFVSLKD